MHRCFDTPEAEIARLKALARYNVMDTAAEQVFDELTRLAAYFCHVPIALITLLDEHRAWIKSATGFDMLGEAPRSISFCNHTIQEHDLLIVPDACQDPRFADNPFVTADPKIRFYAGAPLITPEGFILGSLCVIDHQPRELTIEQKEILRALANQAITQLELRLSVSEVAQRTLELSQAHAALRESENRFRALFEQAGVGVALIGTNTGGFIQTNQKCRSILGYDAEELATLSLPALIHPNGDPAKCAWAKRQTDRLLAGEIPDFSLERQIITKGGALVWAELTISARCTGGAPDGCYIAVLQDISARKRAEASVEEAFKKELLLRREIHHRVKNNLQIISSLLYLQSTQLTDPIAQEMLRASQARTRSIALIHEKLYHSEELARIEFNTYARQLVSDLILAYPSPRGVDLQVDGPNLYFDLDTAIPCGLILTELVSNALKHAFPAERPGLIQIALRRTALGLFDLTVRDNGVGLPANFNSETVQSFGIQLVRDLSRQLGATIQFRSGGELGGELGGTIVELIFPDRTGEATAAAA